MLDHKGIQKKEKEKRRIEGQKGNEDTGFDFGLSLPIPSSLHPMMEKLNSIILVVFSVLFLLTSWQKSVRGHLSTPEWNEN